MLIHLFLWVPNLVDQRKFGCLCIFVFVVLPKSTQKPLEYLSFVEHLIFGFTCTYQIHKNWSQTNNNVSKIGENMY